MVSSPLTHSATTFSAALVADLGHRAHDGMAHRVREQVADETAVDLDHVHRQVLEIPERGHAGAEIV